MAIEASQRVESSFQAHLLQSSLKASEESHSFGWMTVCQLEASIDGSWEEAKRSTSQEVGRMRMESQQILVEGRRLGTRSSAFQSERSTE